MMLCPSQQTPNELIGPAGEALVLFDLLRRGIPTHVAAAGTSYDLIADVGGRLVRVEVKSTGAPRLKRKGDRPSKQRDKLAYVFGLRKKTGVVRYETVGVFAFVALDRQAVLYRPWFDIAGGIVGKHIGVTAFDSCDESFVMSFGAR